MKLQIRTFIAAALIAATASHADVIYDNGSPSASIMLVFSDPGSSGFVADDVTILSGPTTFNRITWWGYYSDRSNPPPPDFVDQFTLSLYESTAGVPNSTASLTFSPLGALTKVNSGIPWGSEHLFKYSIDIAPTTLTLNTTYFLSVVNDTSSVSNNWGWASSPISGTSGSYSRASENFPWSDRSLDLAFNLSNETASAVVPVPAPAMLGILGIGLVGLTRRFRKQAA